MAATTLWVTAPGATELRAEPLSPPGPGDVEVTTAYSGVSRGTEATVLLGRVPKVVHELMRAPNQRGAFSFPVTLGYAAVGIVDAGPPELVGKRVFCLHPHQDRFVVPAQAVVPLPDSVPARRAVLAANLETAVNALWDAPVGPGDGVVVIGAGSVGCLVALLAAQVPGAQVTVIDPSSERRALVETLGISASAPGAGAADADVVFHTSGRAAGLAEAFAQAGMESTIAELSWYGDSDVAAPLGLGFHPRRLRLLSSQVGRVAPSHRPRWSPSRRLGAALSLLGDLRLGAACDRLLSPPGDEIPFAELPARLVAIAHQVGVGAPMPVVAYAGARR
jgi:threonine dehydrogenase-like Zn-dependent dehydrogenase